MNKGIDMIDKKDLFQLTKLSKFEVPDSELESYCREMNEIVDFISISHCNHENENCFSREEIFFREDKPEKIDKQHLFDDLLISGNGYFSIHGKGTANE